MNEKELVQILAKVGDPCAYIKAATLDELYGAVTMPPPFGDDLLLHAEDCPDCAARIREARRHAIDSLPAEAKQQLQHDLARVKANLEATYQRKFGAVASNDAMAEVQPQPGWLKRQWRIIAAGALEFGGAEPALVLGARQKSEPGWPFEVGLQAETGAGGLRVQFNLLGVDLAVRNFSKPGGQAVLIEVKRAGKRVVLSPGETKSLGDIADFRLTGTSDKDEIAKSLEETLDMSPEM